MSHERPSDDSTAPAERRDTADRRVEDRRAHDRYTPGHPSRSDRRQGERRREEA